jgi:hypothetical protein
MSHRARRITSRALLVLAAIVAIVAVLGAWADRQLLDTDEWVDTSSALLQEPAIQDATAAYLADQVEGPEVADQLRKGLPSQLDVLAGPLSAAAGEVAQRTAHRLITSGAFQDLWRTTNRTAHEQLVKVIEGDETILKQGGVILDLRPELGVLASRIGVTPSPDPEHGKVHVLRGDTLDTVRKAADALNTLRWVSAAVLLVLLVAGVAIAPDRRSALLGAGLALLIAGVALLVVRRVAGHQVVDALTAKGANEDAAKATWKIATSLLRDISGTVIVLGAALMAGAWLAGASRWARRARDVVSPVLREHPEVGYGAVALLILILLAAGLLPAAGSLVAVLIYVVLGLAGVAVLRRQVIREAA